MFSCSIISEYSNCLQYLETDRLKSSKKCSRFLVGAPLKYLFSFCLDTDKTVVIIGCRFLPYGYGTLNRAKYVNGTVGKENCDVRNTYTLPF